MKWMTLHTQILALKVVEMDSILAQDALSEPCTGREPEAEGCVDQGVTLSALGALVAETEDGSGDAVLRITLPVPLLGHVAQWEAQLRASWQATDAQQARAFPTLEWCVQVPAAQARPNIAPLPGVRNLIVVASGKGGVGKSTTAVNLALALRAEGAKVGILDADIYGPSQPLMLGIAQAGQPEMGQDKRLVPHQAHGIAVMSMGFLVSDKTPMVWRGPMVSGALMQLLQQTAWPDLDYLIVDMPPGTGDIQLTLSQQVPVDGAVIVTTPQDVACLDARKGIEMFNKVSVPVLGLVENMAVFHCPSCGHAASIFGTDGGKALARDYGVPLLGQLPLDVDIRVQTDAGAPPVVSQPDSASAQAYHRLAQATALTLFRAAQQRQQAPRITILDD